VAYLETEAKGGSS